MLRRDVALAVAGRTDRGVHARGQVASHDGRAGRAGAPLNGLLPADIAVLASEPAPDGFDARRDARSRTYRYRLLARPAPSPFERGRALWWPRPLDRAALDACAAALAGHARLHRLHAHRDRPCSLRARGVSGGMGGGAEDVLAFWIEADSFMRHMVRMLVGTMLGGVEAGALSRDCSRGRRAAKRGRPRPPRPLPGVGPLLTILAWREGPSHKRRRHPGDRAERHAPRAAGAAGRRARGDRAGLEPQRHRAQHHDPQAAVGRGGRVRRRHARASPPTARRSTACASPRSG